MRLAVICCLFVVLRLNAQVTDSLRLVEPDSLAPQPATIVAMDTLRSIQDIQRRPRNALLWSIIPGGGQVYNKRWWKVPLVYGGMLGAVAAADFNQTQFNRYENALANRCLGEGNVVVIPNENCQTVADEFPTDLVSTDALIQARNNADRARQTAYIGIFVVYVLQSVEAYTDAHLQDFDISDDITLRLGPVPGTRGEPARYGLSVRPGPGPVRRQEAALSRLVR